MRSAANQLGKAAAAAALAVVLTPGVAPASERHFAFTTETGTLPAGSAELEPQTTFSAGRDGFYQRLDHRLEFEGGITDQLQTALYINFSNVAQGTGAGRTSEFEYQGISSEWKYKLTDPVADPVGFALYFEVGTGPLETEVEAKLLFDKKLGDVLVAANLVGEYEWEQVVEGLATEKVVETDLACAYLISQHFAAGLELRTHTEFVDTGWEHTAIFAGPALSYSRNRWWAALSVMPQVGGLAPEEEPIEGAEPPSSSLLVLDEHERVSARLIFGFHL